MVISREHLMAFVDGELSAEEERKIAAEAVNDPVLSAYIEEQRAVKARLAQDFAPILSAPVPDRFERMILEAAPRNAPRQPTLMQRILPLLRPSSAWIPAAAVAAGVVIGIGISGLFSPAGMLQNRNGELLASGDLARVLSTQLAADQNAALPARVGVSFVDKAGTFCRSFQTAASGGNALAGIACRSGNAWRVVATAATQVSPGTFRQAAASLPDSLRNAITAMIAGQPLNAIGERDARARNWTR
jgi:hypothetical protein